VKKEDIKEYYRYWHEMFPNGKADRKQFQLYAESILPDARHTDTDYLFRAMDSNRDGEISFNEFLIFQAITSPTTSSVDPLEIIDVCFAMYDKDGDGYLTLSELKETLTNIVKANGKDVTSPRIQEQIDNRIKKLLQACDMNGDGSLTLEEVKNACMKDKSITELF
jgi:Ca2+-binding EF-hand superfamily protein